MSGEAVPLKSFTYNWWHEMVGDACHAELRKGKALEGDEGRREEGVDKIKRASPT